MSRLAAERQPNPPARTEEVGRQAVWRALDMLEQQGRAVIGQHAVLNDRDLLVGIHLHRHDRQIPVGPQTVEK